MFWRGGPTPTADGNVSLVAGTTLGGGTTINWTNCLRTRPWVREQWAEHGLGDVDESAFDRHLDAVLERISANDQCSDLNGTQQRLREGDRGARLELRDDRAEHRPRASYSPETAAYLGFGDQSGSKQSADRTWLADAQEHEARFLTFTRATRVLVEDGRAAGVEAVWQPPDGRGAQVTVRAPRVVVACGSLESPALLLRSGIGGPAVGHNLRLHPSSVVGGAYGTDQEAWWGAAAGRPLRRVRGHGRRLRLPDRDGAVRARADRLCDSVDLGRRPQAAHGGVSLHRELHLPDARPRRRPGERRRKRRGGADVRGD